MNKITTIILALLVTHSAFAQQAKRPAPTVTPATRPAGTVEKEPEEVQKPALFSDTEMRVLRAASTLPVERLVELLSVYEKLDNTAMIDVLVRAILRRDPANADAIRARDGVGEEELRPVGYLDELAKKVMAGQKVDDPDSVSIQANALTTEGRADAGIALLEKLRANQFDDKTFLYGDDLGYAYSEAGRFDDAIRAYEKVATDSRYSPDTRSEAQKMLPALKLKKRIAALRKEAGDDDARLVEMAAKLRRELPNDYEVIVFHVEALDRARRYDDAIAMLLDLKRKHKGPGAWPWQPTLAFAFYGARRHNEAIAAFRAIQSDKGFDPVTRFEAETMILEIAVDREIESGMAALKRADYPAAKAVLNTLTRDFPAHPDTLGYHAIYLAKTGHGKEALAMLRKKKAEVAAQGLPFSQQDAIADVHLEMKDYFLALAATREIIEDPRYDDEMRKAARLKLREIAVSQTLEVAYRALQDGDRARAKKILVHLQRFAPADLEVRVLAADVALSYNKAAQAHGDLVALKPLFPDQPFPGQEALGSALFMLGNWEAAFAAYTEILERPGYDPDEIFEARNSRRELNPLIRPTLSFNSHFEKQEEGTVFGAEASFATSWMKDWRLITFTRTDFISPNNSADSLFDIGDEAFVEGGVTLQRRFNRGYFAEATVGGYNEGVLYGARVGKFPNKAIGWSLGFMGNQRSTESLELQALNGREDRAELRVGGQLAPRWVLDAGAHYSWYKVGGDNIGEGYGADAAVDYILQTETRKRPEVSIGYFGEYSRFEAAGSVPPSVRDEIRRAVVPVEQSRRALASNEEIRRALAGNYGRELLNNLVTPETNRHGLRLTVRKNLDEKWAAFAQIGSYYDFVESSLDYTAAAGVEYYLSDDALLYAELRYDSNGRTSSEGIWEANVGGMMSF